VRHGYAERRGDRTSTGRAQENRGSSAGATGEAFLQPAVDVIEDARGITVLADVPGVNAEGLDVHVEGDTLLIEGTSNLALPQGAQPLYAEQRSLAFRRRVQPEWRSWTRPASRRDSSNGGAAGPHSEDSRRAATAHRDPVRLNSCGRRAGQFARRDPSSHRDRKVERVGLGSGNLRIVSATRL
jgi:hypothetical protein